MFNTISMATDFDCLGYTRTSPTNKKICVPKNCDRSYNCPYPYTCKAGICELMPNPDGDCVTNDGMNLCIKFAIVEYYSFHYSQLHT